MRYEKIGIDLGANSVKIVSFRGEDESYGIKAMEIFYVSEEPFSGKYFHSLKKFIKSFLKKNKIFKASLCFTISSVEDLTMEHTATFPIIKKRFLKKSIRFEIEDSGKYDDLQNYYYNWEVSRVDNENNRQEILVLGIKKSIINHLSKINGFKTKIANIETQPVSIGRVVEGTKLILDFGQESTRIFYYEDKKPTLIRSITMGGKDIDEILRAEYPDNSNEDISHIKQTLSIREDHDQKSSLVRDNIESFANSLIEEIRRYVRSIELQNELYFDEILYTGGLLNLLGLREYISAELSIALLPLSTGMSVIDTELSDGEVSMFLSSISAASYKDIPYLPELHFTKHAKTQMDYSPVFIAVLCSSLILNYAAMDVNNRYDSRMTELNQMSLTQTSVVSSLQNDLNSVNSEIEASQRYIDKAVTMSIQNKWMSDVFYMLMAETPKEVVIESMNIEDGNILITGYGRDYSSIAFVIMRLEKYGDVSLDSVTNEIGAEIYSKDEKLMSRGFNLRLSYDNSRRLYEGLSSSELTDKSLEND